MRHLLRILVDEGSPSVESQVFQLQKLFHGDGFELFDLQNGEFSNLLIPQKIFLASLKLFLRLELKKRQATPWHRIGSLSALIFLQFWNLQLAVYIDV